MLLPQITVITPVFNGAEHIAETLESILRQDYPKLEYIIVDGGSTDETLDIIRGYEARSELPQHISLVISEPDHGMYDAIAKGFEYATGEIFCYLNADDLFECSGLRSVGEYFARHPEAQVIYHEDTVLVDGWKYPNTGQPENINTADLLNAHILFQDGVFFRRTAYEAVGGVRRDFKLAGDFDLWLRLSAHFRFVRRPGHVSCFRLRPDQLSSRMDIYHREMKQSIADFLSHTPVARSAKLFVQRLFWRAHRIYLSVFHRGRLFFPIDGVNFPPPAGTLLPGAEKVPRSPIDGKPAERLLFTTPDTRFGERELNYIYLDDRHGIAISHPHIAAKRLDALYQMHYSSPSTDLKPPETISPYRQFNGQRKWEEILLRLPLGALARFLFPAAWSDNIWSDNTLRELIKTLNESKIDTSKELRFLDTGCFEGYLLDQIRDNTRWISFGLEPNSLAVKIANEKGHAVWWGHAEDAGSLIPKDQQFDVIFMGQSIEHIDDPVRVLVQLRRLLAPDGVLVVSTPNLDSREIDWFGPTWAHWHPPYHRYIYSKKGLHSLAQQVGLLPVHFQTFSNPTWTTMSLSLNRMGLTGSASHSVNIDLLLARKAQWINFWKEIIWNRLDKGDYCFFAMKNSSHGMSHHD
jgi:glycosyltransferase involved in cell wall biosynthesis/SAM-dependent methyltransferase